MQGRSVFNQIFSGKRRLQTNFELGLLAESHQKPSPLNFDTFMKPSLIRYAEFVQH